MNKPRVSKYIYYQFKITIVRQFSFYFPSDAYSTRDIVYEWIPGEVEVGNKELAQFQYIGAKLTSEIEVFSVGTQIYNCCNYFKDYTEFCTLDGSMSEPSSRFFFFFFLVFHLVDILKGVALRLEWHRFQGGEFSITSGLIHFAESGLSSCDKEF